MRRICCPVRARAVCRLVNHEVGIDCKALVTSGPLFNLDNVRGGVIEFGLAPSDLHYHAVNESGPFTFVDATYENLRSVLSLHGEPLTLIARRDAGIRSLADLPGKRTNLGAPGSAERALMATLLRAQRWGSAAFGLAEGLPAAQQSLSLCHGRIQVMVYYGPHPDPGLDQTTALCEATLVDVGDGEIDKLIAENSYLSKQTIAGSTYASLPDSVNSFGTTVTLITSIDTEGGTVRDVVRSVLVNFPWLARTHPTLRTLQPGDMVRRGLAAPLHDGALRYYSEIGIL